MRNVSEEYRAAAIAAGRNWYIKLHLKYTRYKKSGEETVQEIEIMTDRIIALKIVHGQTTGEFALGGVQCATLTATLTNAVKFATTGVEDKYVENIIDIDVGFKDPSTGEDLGSQKLGSFIVDEIQKSMYTQSITAYDVILTTTKAYGPTAMMSGLVYPASASQVLAAAFKGKISEDIEYINDAKINSQEDIFMSQRDMIGWIAAINGGSAYYDAAEGLKISYPRYTGYTIHAKNTISQEVEDTNYTINEIVMNNDSETSLSAQPDYEYGTLEFAAPLDFDRPDEIVANLNDSRLKGLSYDAVTIKKQGTAIFQLGDIVSYEALDATMYRMLIIGIVYEFSDGFFYETLYSLAKSATQQQYQNAKKSTGGGVVKAKKENFITHYVYTGLKSDEGACAAYEEVPTGEGESTT